MSKRKFYSQEFKREAVSLVVDQDYSCAEADRSLGVRGNLVGRWKRELESGGSAFHGGGKLTTDQQRIRDLATQVRHQETDRGDLVGSLPLRKVRAKRAT